MEIAEQLNWSAPDALAVSVGDGSIISAVYKGFSDLIELGWLEKMPRLLGVQAEGSSVLAQAFASGAAPEAIRRGRANTIADSISSELPRDRAKALRAVRSSGGAFVTVSDEAILAAIPTLARFSGVFGEPAAAAALAGLERAVKSGLIAADESVCLLCTGNGLKDVARARQAVGAGRRVAPDLDAVRQALKEARLL